MPRIIGWAAFVAVLLLLGPIAYAVAMLRSGPEADGSDPAATLLIALLVLAAAAIAGWLARLATKSVLRLVRRD